MLTYLILSTRAILMLFIIAGVITGYNKTAADKTGKIILLAGAVLGLILSITMAVFRSNTSLVSTSLWNSIMYKTALLSYIVFLVTSFFTQGKKVNMVMVRLSECAISLFLSMIMFYYLPEYLMYPGSVYLTEKTALSTDFMYAMIGLLFGGVLSVLGFFSAMKCESRLKKRSALNMERIICLPVIFLFLAGQLSVWHQSRDMVLPHSLFTFVIFIKNHSDYGIYISAGLVALSGVYLLIKSFTERVPYKNPAEHRKIRAKWLNIRRWSAVAIIVLILGVLNITVVEAANTKEVTLSPIEDAETDDENVYVTFEQVSDGHLHRFAYEAENGTAIRFIVIKKPNSNSYGVGLDACDICGETGYYERDGQVICSLCDVVMNISTIGFKGGCNPIVIPYEINNGKIIVPIDGLLEYKSEFE